jgi:hypothetical protein
MMGGPGASVHVGIRAVPDDLLVSKLLLIGPLWKSGEITVWRSGAAFVDLSPDLAQAMQTGRIESGAIFEGISELASRWIATRWPGALVVNATCLDHVSFDGWSEGARHHGGENLTLAVLYPRHPCHGVPRAPKSSLGHSSNIGMEQRCHDFVFP